MREVIVFHTNSKCFVPKNVGAVIIFHSKSNYFVSKNVSAIFVFHTNSKHFTSENVRAVLKGSAARQGASSKEIEMAGQRKVGRPEEAGAGGGVGGVGDTSTGDGAGVVVANGEHPLQTGWSFW